MKIYGSLFLWVPLAIFLIWLGIKELPDDVLVKIKEVLLVVFALWNILVIIMFIFDKDIRKSVKELILINFSEVLITIVLCPIMLIPFITYYLNDKLTIKI